MSETRTLRPGVEPAVITPSQRLARDVGILAGRLAGLLERVLSGSGAKRDASVAAENTVAFLRQSCADAAAIVVPDTPLGHPLDRLARGLELEALEIELVLLAGMAEEHEGYADVLRSLHPQDEPWPTASLAAQLLVTDVMRPRLRRLLETGPASVAGALRLDGEGPFFQRSLRLADALWLALHGIDAWPRDVCRESRPPAIAGLEPWLAEPVAVAAREALVQGGPATVLVTADDEEVAFERAAALAAAAGVESVRVRLPQAFGRELVPRLSVHALARGVVPILRLARPEGPGVPYVPAFDHHPAPVVVCARTGAAAIEGCRPLVAVACEPLRPAALQHMWRCTLPQLAAEAPLLAARYPLEPSFALQVATDLDYLERLQRRPAGLGDVAASVRARAGIAVGAGVKVVRPTAGWPHLVLRPERLRMLREAVDRLLHQATVLDEWHFLEGRHGARGVRLLLAGPSGTGKTLASEVLAHALEVDLLVVDLSRVVSKWIGETEKNLAQVFETAERARAVLMFDEADALFGRRTEISDAHDRYANLETAYLLARLERFEGLVILATNLRQNIDPAFLRRLEFMIELEAPDRAERLALWRCHLPDSAPVDDSVDLGELADLYPMVGGMIRNAAVAAGFLAAAADTAIHQQHLLRAVWREYEKSGKAFPGYPRGCPPTEKGE